MNRQQIEAKLTIELANGIGFEKSTYNLSQEWQKKAFQESMKNIVKDTDVHIRWVMFRAGMRAAMKRLSDLVIEGDES
jgi:hypothetical protein